jgi:hypothetical protein
MNDRPFDWLEFWIRFGCADNDGTIFGHSNACSGVSMTAVAHENARGSIGLRIGVGARRAPLQACPIRHPSF